jgi:hypothetical protein
MDRAPSAGSRELRTRPEQRNLAACHPLAVSDASTGLVAQGEAHVILSARRSYAATLTTLAVSAAVLCGPAVAAGNNGDSGAKVGQGGFLVNVIAFENCPSGEFTESNRRMIAVQADYSLNQGGNLAGTIVKTNTIELASSGIDGGFQVVDGNACANRGRDGAKLMLPVTLANCADVNGDCTVEDPTFTQYRVYVRMVGKPGGVIDVTTCAEETDDTIFSDDDGGIDALNILCSTESVVEVRETGKGKLQFQDYTKQLLTICLDTFVDENFYGACDERVPLFSETLENYFWQWNTAGRAHAQLVFRPVL